MSASEKKVCELRYRIAGREQSFFVGDKPITIGRAPECDLVLPDESISRVHAEIRLVQDEMPGSADSVTEPQWEVLDSDSKNGVLIDTHPCARQRLRNGDCIDLGGVRLSVQIGPASSSARAQVVFENRQERGRRTEIINMDELDALMRASVEPPQQGVLHSRPLVTDPEDGVGGEPPEQIHLLREAAEALLSCDTLDETLDRILALVFRNLPAERGVICLYDETTDTHTPKVMRNREGVPHEPILISSNIAKDVIDRKQSLLVQDTRLDERFGSAHSVILAEIHSAMCAPLYASGRVAGFVYVDRQSDRHPFEAAHLHTLSALAVLSAVAVEKAGLRESVRHEQEMRARLTRYSSPAVVDRILQAPGVAQPGMAADECDVTVLFADLTGFTAMAETLGSAEVVRILNQVFEQLTEVVFEHDGTLDKFRGDGMMAFFGAPLALPDHAERAVHAALCMQERLELLRDRALEGRPITMRIGINSGSVVVGDIGSPQRKDYTVIGDVVNTASRLESSVAEPGQVVIGPGTFERVSDRFACQSLDEVRLKGKRQSVRPYLVLSDEGPPNT